MDGWTTLLDPKLTRPYGIEELYKVCFEPLGWPGKGVVIGLGMIPECEQQCCVPMDEGDPVVMVNRPRVNAGDDPGPIAPRAANPRYRWPRNSPSKPATSIHHGERRRTTG